MQKHNLFTSTLKLTAILLITIALLSCTKGSEPKELKKEINSFTVSLPESYWKEADSNSLNELLVEFNKNNFYKDAYMVLETAFGGNSSDLMELGIVNLKDNSIKGFNSNITSLKEKLSQFFTIDMHVPENESDTVLNFMRLENETMYLIIGNCYNPSSKKAIFINIYTPKANYTSVSSREYLAIFENITTNKN